MYNEKAYLEQFEPIYLEQIKEVELMNRVDTKFIVSRKLFNEILPELAIDYKVLEVEGTRLSAYRTQYFDTVGYNLFLDHHNGKELRYKVRIRKYVESAILFLEVKKKYKGRTIKRRISIADFEKELTTGSKEFIRAVAEKEVDLEQKLYNMFSRITLISKSSKERLTIDLNLSYTDEISEKTFDHVVIAELKQERFDTNSPFYRLMKKNYVRPSGFSKYCIGAISLNAALKYNNFKEKLLLMDKLK